MKRPALKHTVTGKYARNAEIEDIEFLLECTRDWPNGKWSYSMCESVVKTSIGQNLEVAYLNRLDGTKEIDRLCGIFCKADGTKLAFHIWSLYVQPEGVPDSSQTFAMAVHPTYRGQGFHTEFVHLLDWMTLNGITEESHYEAIDHALSGAVPHSGTKKNAIVGVKRNNGRTSFDKTRYIEQRNNIATAFGEFDADLYEDIEIEI
jgi:GNAT superfamily N-acetyltransferase